MEITPSTVYWIMQFDRLRDVACGCMLVSGIVLIIWSLVACFLVFGEDLDKAKAFLVGLGCLLLFLLFSAASAFMPDTKTAIAMYCIPKAINSEVVEQLQGDAKELYTLGVERLKKELKGGTKNEK